MRAAVLQFPGSNGDTDALIALRSLPGVSADLLWHEETSVKGFDLIVLPGGFSYGDYLRCGAIARFSPIMQAVKESAAEGTFILGICNGFQILCEAKLLPGTLIANRNLLFCCQEQIVRVETDDSPFTKNITSQSLLHLPIAHGEGCYVADEATRAQLNLNHQVLLRYADATGKASKEANPNGSLENIAGICNLERNIFGLMPHPERACEELLGSCDGRGIFESILTMLQDQQ